jgi:hypothetical protein
VVNVRRRIGLVASSAGMFSWSASMSRAGKTMEAGRWKVERASKSQQFSKRRGCVGEIRGLEIGLHCYISAVTRDTVETRRIEEYSEQGVSGPLNRH